mmetsp:Transcript_25038/g.48913  ORF Transcript_25038/g.48913 Transcript_25038/m.48913 type:complete len:177 (+) Transcript_25038:48-578(+)
MDTSAVGKTFYTPPAPATFAPKVVGMQPKGDFSKFNSLLRVARGVKELQELRTPPPSAIFDPEETFPALHLSPPWVPLSEKKSYALKSGITRRRKYRDCSEKFEKTSVGVTRWRKEQKRMEKKSKRHSPYARSDKDKQQLAHENKKSRTKKRRTVMFLSPAPEVSLISENFLSAIH